MDFGFNFHVQYNFLLGCNVGQVDLDVVAELLIDLFQGEPLRLNCVSFRPRSDEIGTYLWKGHQDDGNT